MKPTKAIREQVPEPAANEILILIGPWIWGKGKTVATAFKNFRGAGYRVTDKVLAYHAHPDTHVTDMGGLEFPADHPPTEVARIE